mgnify:CR=1 FL=1
MGTPWEGAPSPVQGIWNQLSAMKLPWKHCAYPMLRLSGAGLILFVTGEGLLCGARSLGMLTRPYRWFFLLMRSDIVVSSAILLQQNIKGVAQEQNLHVIVQGYEAERLQTQLWGIQLCQGKCSSSPHCTKAHPKQTLHAINKSLLTYIILSTLNKTAHSGWWGARGVTDYSTTTVMPHEDALSFRAAAQGAVLSLNAEQHSPQSHIYAHMRFGKDEVIPSS